MNNLKPHIFHGQVKKVKIISNNICYGPSPQPDEEIEQHLTINRGGRVWFSGYNYGEDNGQMKLGRRKNFSIDKEASAGILNAVGVYFGNEYEAVFATDIGSWELHITNTEDSIFSYRGSLCCNFFVDSVDLSALIRGTLELPELFVFDGNPSLDNMGEDNAGKPIMTTAVESGFVDKISSPVYIFCSVTFSKDGRSYYYITEDITLEVGDAVLVPVEYYGRTGKARITKIEHFAEESVPFPLKRVKKIIMKLTEEQYRMPTMLFGEFKNNDNEKVEPKSSPSPEINRILLCREKESNISYYIWAEFTSGRLTFAGLDSGMGVEGILGQDYEYEYVFDRQNTGRLVGLLAPEGQDVNEILIKRFSGRLGFRALLDFCKENNITYSFSSLRV